MTEENIDLEYFPAFLRTFYPAAKEFKNADCIQLGRYFYRWLELNHPDDLVHWQLKPERVSSLRNFPGYKEGYSVQLLLIFHSFIKNMT